MATKNVALDLINADDLVSVDPLNTNFNKIDEQLADGVIERGMSGEWWYRKWRNGRYECGIEFKWLNKSNLTTVDNFGWTNGYSLPAYPITFVGRPYCNVIYMDENGGNYAAVQAIVAMNKQISRSNPPTFRIGFLHASKPVKPAIGCHVIGRWK